jgi:hypothetical protein
MNKSDKYEILTVLWLIAAESVDGEWMGAACAAACAIYGLSAIVCSFRERVAPEPLHGPSWMFGDKGNPNGLMRK